MAPMSFSSGRPKSSCRYFARFAAISLRVRSRARACVLPTDSLTCGLAVADHLTQQSSAFSEVAQFLLLADDADITFALYRQVAQHLQRRSVDLLWSSTAGDVILYMLTNTDERNRLLSIQQIATLLSAPSVPEKQKKRVCPCSRIDPPARYSTLVFLCWCQFRLDEFGGFEVLWTLWRGFPVRPLFIRGLYQLILEKVRSACFPRAAQLTPLASLCMITRRDPIRRLKRTRAISSPMCRL